MKNLLRVVELLRKSVVEGFRVTREDASTKPLELVEEANPRQVDLFEKHLIKKFEVAPARPPRDLFAVDSSSRVVETPYVFLAIAAGTVHSRFTGKGIDVPSLASIVGVEEPPCRHIALVPEVESPREVAEAILSARGITTSNPLGVAYTSTYNKHALLAELRLSLEQCLLELFSSSELAESGTILLLDGPLAYPTTPMLVEPRDFERVRIYVEAIELLNKKREQVVSKLAEKGLQVISVVKRLHKSYILSLVDPASISPRGKVNDEAYLSTLVLTNSGLYGQPFIVGPILVKQKPPCSLNRIVWYIGFPRRIYPLRGGLGNYVFYRVEVFEKMISESVLNYIAYDSIHTGSLLPLSILVADRRVKKLTSSLVNYILYLTGLTEESTKQYISML